MKCPNCGMELEEGKLLCESCGEEVKIVPDFDIELENELKESISSMLEDIAAQEQTKEAASRTSDDGFSTIKDALSAYSSKESIIISSTSKSEYPNFKYVLYSSFKSCAISF